MSKPNNTRKVAAPRARTTIARAVPGQAAPVAASASDSPGAAPQSNVFALPTEAHAYEVLRLACRSIEIKTDSLDAKPGSGATYTGRSMAATVAAFNAVEGTSLTERQGWALLQLLSLTRSANAARNGNHTPSHLMNAAAFAALGQEAAFGEKAPG